MDLFSKIKMFNHFIGNNNNNSFYPSTLSFKYPTYRDHPLHSGELWLKGKRADDNAENLWRVHNGLYDLTSFVSQHPGGKDWLKLTKGTDITEAFESHHITTLAETILPKYYIREAKYPRNSPFTFKDGGFYKTMKANIRQALRDVPKSPEHSSKLICDSLFISYILFAFSAVYFWSFTCGFISGLILCLNANAAHNFFHQKDSFRMYYFDFTLMSSKGWRISHAMSHHLYTNTIQDLEISTLEPFLQYLPQEKHFFFRYLSLAYSPIVYCFMYYTYWATDTIQSFILRDFSMVQLLPFTVPLAMVVLSGQPIIWTILMYIFILTSSSFVFGVIGVNAAHHHPEIFHDGDTPRSTKEIDWGFHQLDCVMDRREINESHFLVMTSYGDHALHHLFPTIDHGRLRYLYPVFNKICEEFGIKYRMTSQLELIKGQFFQLMKITPNPNPPKLLKHSKD